MSSRLSSLGFYTLACLASAILPPHSHASSALAQVKEAKTPSHWPAWEVPNFSDWAVGDIVLVRAPSPSSPVLLVQAGSPNHLIRQGCSWTHAGVYVGDGNIVDAMYKHGVVRQSVWNYCQSRSIRVRRLPSKLPRNKVATMAPIANGYVGQPYATWAAILHGFAHYLVPGAVFPLPTAEALYCSTLVALCVTHATGFALGAAQDCMPIFPATLAVHPSLTDVPLEWRQV